jgi:nitrile hydratase accessory protein
MNPARDLPVRAAEPGSAWDRALEAGESPHFQSPWEARAFAMVVKLAEAGHFTWPEWVDFLSRSIAESGINEASDGRPRSYGEQWIAAAESLLISKGVTSAEQLRAKRLACWPVNVDHAHVTPNPAGVNHVNRS